MAIQWHPLFAQLLRGVLDEYYEVQTDVPVGEMPRQADIVLVRRRHVGATPFRGIWRLLTEWNVIEFKSPLVTPRLRDIDRLMELGLGVDRRLNEERLMNHLPEVGRPDVSFWYLANRLSSRFVHEVEALVGKLEPIAQGMYQTQLLGRRIVLASNVDLAVDSETFPVHIVSQETPTVVSEMIDLVSRKPPLRETYGAWLSALHPGIWKGVEAMSKTATTAKTVKKRKKWEFDFEPLIKYVGIEQLIESMGRAKVIEAIGEKRMIEALGRDNVIEALGRDNVIEALGRDQLLEDLLRTSTPAQKKTMLERFAKSM